MEPKGIRNQSEDATIGSLPRLQFTHTRSRVLWIAIALDIARISSGCGIFFVYNSAVIQLDQTRPRAGSNALVTTWRVFGQPNGSEFTLPQRLGPDTRQALGSLCAIQNGKGLFVGHFVGRFECQRSTLGSVTLVFVLQKHQLTHEGRDKQWSLKKKTNNNYKLLVY